MAVGVLEGDLAVALAEGVAGEAGRAGSVSDVRSPAERVQRLAPGGGLVVEVAGEAASADSTCVEAPAEGILCPA